MRILFVESDRFLRAYFKAKLIEELKCVVDSAASGKEAIKMLKESPAYDVIVSDLLVTHGFGISIFKYKEKYSPETSFIIFTNSNHESLNLLHRCIVIDKTCFASLVLTIRRLKDSPNCSKLEHLCLDEKSILLRVD